MTRQFWSGIISTELSKPTIVEEDTWASSIRRRASSDETLTGLASWSLDMGISYRLAAFDRRTERLVGVDVIPRKFVPEIRRIAQIPASDDGAGDYPLNAGQVSKIAERLGITVDPVSTDYFIEPYVQETQSAPQKATER